MTCGECVRRLSFVNPDTVPLVRQDPYTARRPTWEMPTGGVHAGEAVEQAIVDRMTIIALLLAARRRGERS